MNSQLILLTMKSARKITLARAKRVHTQAHESRGAVSLEVSHLRERSKASYFLHGISSFFPNTTSNLGRALHRNRRGHGFKSRRGLNFFFRFDNCSSSAGISLQRSLSC